MIPELRLIAAAPDLLAACRMALHYFENHVDHAAFDVAEEITGLRAAIQKATGEAP